MERLHNKDILSIEDLSSNEIQSIIDLALFMKKEIKETTKNTFSLGKVIGLLFQKPSTRTRVSFETGMLHLGGNSIYLNASDMQLSRGESIEDTARTLSLYLDCIVARVFDHSEVVQLAKFSSIPVINGLSNLYHPCQILADLMTIYELKGNLNGLKLAWIGDGNNVCNDMIQGCSKTGISITVACPKGYEPLDEVIRKARKNCIQNNCNIDIVNDSKAAVRDADIVVTDTFVSIGKDAEKLTRKEIFLPNFQVNAELMRLAKNNSIFMHCLPARRGEEVTDDVIDGDKSVVWQEAENRLHVQKALMYMLMHKN